MRHRVFLAATTAIVVFTSLAYGDTSLTANGLDADYYYVESGQIVQIGVNAQNESFFDLIVCIADDPVSQASGSWTGYCNVYNYDIFVYYLGDAWSLASFFGFDLEDGIVADFELLHSESNDMTIELKDQTEAVIDSLILYNVPDTAADIHFYTTVAEGNPMAETFTITNSGPGIFNWTIDHDCSWLTVDPNSGSFAGESDTVTLSVDITGLTETNYYCDFTISDPTGLNDPQTVRVGLHIGEITILGKGAFTTIQDAIDMAISGVDTVIVGDGIFTGPGNRGIDFLCKAITVRSANGPENCIIDCQWSDCGFYFQNGENQDSILQGFTVIHGLRPDSDSEGGGISCENSSPLIKECILENNGSISLTWGGGIGCIYSDAIIEYCIIKNNAAIRGGGISIRYGSPVIKNCLIVDNVASLTRYGGGIACKGGYHTPKIINCTLFGNSAGRGGAIDLITTTATITNCIFRGNSPSEIAGTAIVTYSNIAGGFAGEGNIDVGPQFAAPDNYHLAFGSPCIDSGTNTPSGGLPATDLDGTVRPIDGDGDDSLVADMGAYEFYYDQDSPIVGISPVEFYFSCPIGGPDPNSQTLGIWNGAGGVLNWQISEDCNWLEVSSSSGTSIGEIDNVTLTVDSTGLSADMYNCTLSVFNADEVNDIRYVDVSFRVGPAVLVPSQYSTIQAAINAAFDRDEVIVADGIYTGSGNRDIDFLGKAITVRSASGDPSRCVVDCEGTNANNHRGFIFDSCEDRKSVLDGFGIINGYLENAIGGGICISYQCVKPTIRNCVIENCTAYSGGGIYSAGAPLISNCVIRNNYAYYDTGGGIVCWQGSKATISNCVVENNTAKYQAGGIFCYGTTIIENSIIVKNSCEQDSDKAGIVIWRNGHIIRNCTIAGNFGIGLRGASSSTGHVTVSNSIIWDGISGSSGDTITEYCNITGGRAGVGNINIEPQFVNEALGDYHLQWGSPCIDTGTNSPSGGLPGEDLDGNARPQDGDGDGQATADMGAYESLSFEQPNIGATPSQFQFNAFKDGDDPDDQTLTIRNTWGGVLTWAIEETCDWLDVSLLSGSLAHDESDEVNLSIDISGLTYGQYNCDLTISDPNATNKIVNVSLLISDELYVPSQYGTIQSAIDAALNGDIIIVDPNTYYENINFNGKNVILTSTNPTDPGIVAGTIIDGSSGAGQVVLFGGTEDASCELTGFTITGGYNTGNGGGVQGSGAYAGISRCVIRAC